MTDELPIQHRRKLQHSVIAGIVVVTFGFIRWLIFLPFFLPLIGLPVMLLLVGAAFYGAVCGISVLFFARGFYRLVAVLSSLVCFYALIRSAGFYGWAINLP